MAPNKPQDSNAGMDLVPVGDFKPAKYQDEVLDAIKAGVDGVSFQRYLDDLHALIDRIHGEFLANKGHGHLGPRVLVLGALGRAVASRFFNKHRECRVVLAELHMRDLLPGDLGPTVELMELPPPSSVPLDETLSSDDHFDLVIAGLPSHHFDQGPGGDKSVNLKAYAKRLKPYIRRRDFEDDDEQNPVQFICFELLGKSTGVREELRFAGYGEAKFPGLPGLKKVATRLDYDVIPCTLPSYQFENKNKIRLANLRTCLDIVIFFVFLFIFTSVVLIEQSASSSRLGDHVHQKFRGGPVPLESVSTIHGLHDFLEQTFVPALYDNITDTEVASRASNHLLPIDISNRLLGQVRLRQVKVKLDPACQLSPLFSQYTIACYPQYSSGAEDNDRFGPDRTWAFSSDESGQSYGGYMGSYGPGGYMQFLSPNKTLAMETLQMLRDEVFLSGATRAVFIDFTVWNSNVGSYAVAQIPVEFGASGHVYAALRTTILTERGLAFFLAGFGTMADWLSLIGTFLVLLFVFWYIKEEIGEILEKKFYYLLDPWNVIDWTNMFLIFTAFILRIMVFMEADSIQIGADELYNRESFTNLRSIAWLVELIRLVYAFNTVMLWVKCVKYLRHFPVVKVLVQTVWSAFSLFIPFLVLVLIVFIAFIFAYNIGFGDKIWDLSTFGRSSVYLSRAFMRDVKMMPVYQMTPIFGATLILLFYVGVGLVSINVLAAIVADAVHQSKNAKRSGRADDDEGEEEEESTEDQPLEELQREITRIMSPFVASARYNMKYQLALNAPALHDLIFRPKSAVGADPAAESQKPLQAAIVDAGDDGVAGTIWWTKDQKGNLNIENAPPKPVDLMHAIEHMSGRVLSEIQEVGIEIRAELHDVCERVAQMHMAVDELGTRIDRVSDDQKELLPRR